MLSTPLARSPPLRKHDPNPFSSAQIQTLALQLANILADQQRDYRSASQIHTDYLHDIPTSVRLLCRGSYFSEALRLLSLHNLTAQIPDLIDTALAEKSGEITELIADCRAQLLAQVPRIKELRVKKTEDPLGFFGGDPTTGEAGEGGGGDGEDIPDNISLAPTDSSTMGGQSLFTRYTGHHTNTNHASANFAGTITSSATRQTSRTRRREERKRARGKKGSVYEEEYLVGSVRRLVERVNATHGEVGRLVQALRRRELGIGMGERVEMVEDVMRRVEGDCIRAVREVWGVDSLSGVSVGKEVCLDEEGGSRGAAGNVVQDVATARPRGADGVFWESRLEALQGSRQAPEVKGWKSME